MHRLRSKSAVFRLRIAALLLCAKCILVPITGGLLLYAIAISNVELISISLGMIGICIVVILLQWMIAQRTNCPLCRTPVLAKKKCAKHRHARKLLGSHRLQTALSILFTNSFHCPYCNEPTALEVRDPQQRSRHSKG